MSKKKTDTAALKQIVIDALLDKKGNRVVSLDLSKINDAPADCFVIAHGESNTQTRALFDNVIEEAKKKGHLAYRTEGQANGEWMIADFVDVVVHVFVRDKREFYHLEDLWSDAEVQAHDDTPLPAPKPKKIAVKKGAAKKSVAKKAAPKKKAK